MWSLRLELKTWVKKRLMMDAMKLDELRGELSGREADFKKLCGQMPTSTEEVEEELKQHSDSAASILKKLGVLQDKHGVEGEHLDVDKLVSETEVSDLIKVYKTMDSDMRELTIKLAKDIQNMKLLTLSVSRSLHSLNISDKPNAQKRTEPTVPRRPTSSKVMVIASDSAHNETRKSGTGVSMMVCFVAKGMLGAGLRGTVGSGSRGRRMSLW